MIVVIAVVVVAIVVAFVAIAVVSRQRRQDRRARALAGVAPELGLHYAHGDARRQVTRLPLPLVGGGPEPRVSNVLTGSLASEPLRIFDLTHETPEGVRVISQTWSCAVVDIAADFPVTSLRRREQPGGDHPGEPLRTGNYAIDSHFRVRSEDPDFVTGLLGAGVGKWLAEDPVSVSFELAGRYLACHADSELPPERIGELVRAIAGFRRRIPDGFLRRPP